MILGHAYPPVIDAVKKACENGLSYGAPTAKETELATLILEAMFVSDAHSKDDLDRTIEAIKNSVN